MRSFFMVSIAGLALAGCDQIKQGNSDSDLIGGWSCSQNADGGSAKVDMQYASGGRSSAQFEMSMVEEGMPIEVMGSGTGTWELEGDKLTEEVTKFTIIAMSVNGQAVTDQSVLKNFETAMVDQITTSTIKSLDEDSLFLTTSGGPLSCTRKG